MPPRHRLALFLGALIAGLTVQAVWACSVPVFRYALEHWAADPFQVVVFHRGPLTADQQSLVAKLNPAQGDAHANATLRLVNLDEDPKPELLALWQQQDTQTVPWVTVRWPSRSGLQESVLGGPLAAETIDNLLHSPVRQAVLDRLGEGESAVWLFLDSGDKIADDAATALLEKRLEYLAGVLTLPKLDEQDIANGLVSVAEDELRLDFSVLRLRRSDQAERALIQMLLHSEPDLADVTEPMVFPIFGRGRALYALVGDGIRNETIEQAATFLIGKCSCQVKEQNPGVDLLFTANWEKVVKASPLLDRDLPTLAELAGPVSVTMTGPSAPPAVSRAQPMWLWLLIGAIAAGGAIIGLRQRQRP